MKIKSNWPQCPLLLPQSFLYFGRRLSDAGCLLGLFWARPPALSRPAALHELEIICTPTLELVLLPQKHQPLGSANHQHANQPPLQRAGKTSFPHLKKPLPHSPIFLLPTQLMDPQLYLAALLPAPGCLPSQCHSLPQLRSAPFLPPHQDGYHRLPPGRVQRSGCWIPTWEKSVGR